MRQIIINDELIGDEQLYYYQNDNAIIIYIKNSLRSFRQRYILATTSDTSVAQNIIFYLSIHI